MSNSWFQFKQFRIEQARSALKVGTDGVLLGAWCDVTGVETMLDVGTGTGLLALMLAQRSASVITAIEIDGNACQDAQLNFENSPWTDRLKLLHADFSRLEDAQYAQFDLVVSNPPYFIRSVKPAEMAASIARHDVSLSFQQLISGSKKILKPTGRLAVVLPADVADDFRELARLEGFYLKRKTVVIPKTGKPAKRTLMEFSLVPVYPVVDELIVLVEVGRYSEEFISLTRDYYLSDHF